MDFHRAFAETIQAFPQLDGIIFVDPDGESITFEAPGLSNFNIRLAGAKMHLLVKSFETGTEWPQPGWIEMNLENRWLLYINLNQDYSLTAVFRNESMRYRLRRHLFKLAKGFNRDII
ncbi:MAG: hypothetical protein H6510_03340 [Acidobacteria bacterium]|nr:hypothetical protein [Acidobacteriota bacterium]